MTSSTSPRQAPTATDSARTETMTRSITFQEGLIAFIDRFRAPTIATQGSRRPAVKG